MAKKLIFLLLSIFLILTSCESKVNINEHNSNHIYINIDNTLEAKDKVHLMWELTNNIEDSILNFKVHNHKDSVSVKNWYFILDDSIPSRFLVNSNNSCGVGMTITDSLSWNQSSDTVKLFISTTRIGYGREKIISGIYKKELVSDKKIKLIKMNELYN